MLYKATFTTYNGSIRIIDGIKANTKENAIKIALKIAKISLQPLQFQDCIEYQEKE